MILQLINSKGRIVWKADWDYDNTIKFEHECGAGWGYKTPEQSFLSTFCALNDNPSCQFDGSHVESFLAYCKEHIDWMCPSLKKKFEVK